jgi:hypothetical protein
VIDFEYVIPQPSKPCMIINSIIKYSIEVLKEKISGRKVLIRAIGLGCVGLPLGITFLFKGVF